MPPNKHINDALSSPKPPEQLTPSIKQSLSDQLRRNNYIPSISSPYHNEKNDNQSNVDHSLTPVTTTFSSISPNLSSEYESENEYEPDPIKMIVKTLSRNTNGPSPSTNGKNSNGSNHSNNNDNYTSNSNSNSNSNSDCNTGGSNGNGGFGGGNNGNDGFGGGNNGNDDDDKKDDKHYKKKSDKDDDNDDDDDDEEEEDEEEEEKDAEEDEKNNNLKHPLNANAEPFVPHDQKLRTIPEHSICNENSLLNEYQSKINKLTNENIQLKNIINESQMYKQQSQYWKTNINTSPSFLSSSVSPPSSCSYSHSIQTPSYSMNSESNNAWSPSVTPSHTIESKQCKVWLTLQSSHGINEVSFKDEIFCGRIQQINELKQKDQLQHHKIESLEYELTRKCKENVCLKETIETAVCDVSCVLSDIIRENNKYYESDTDSMVDIRCADIEENFTEITPHPQDILNTIVDEAVFTYAPMNAPEENAKNIDNNNNDTGDNNEQTNNDNNTDDNKDQNNGDDDGTNQGTNGDDDDKKDNDQNEKKDENDRVCKNPVCAAVKKYLKQLVAKQTQTIEQLENGNKFHHETNQKLQSWIKTLRNSHRSLLTALQMQKKYGSGHDGNKQKNKRKNKKKQIKSSQKHLFSDVESAPCYQPSSYTRAKGNIFISRKMSETIVPSKMNANKINCYKYMDKSVAMQFNDQCQTIENIDKHTVAINFDFYDEKKQETYYCIIKKHSKEENKNLKYKMIDGLFTKKEVIDIDKDIMIHKSSRQELKSQLESKNDVVRLLNVKYESIINVKWFNISIFRRNNKRYNKQRIVLCLESEYMKKLMRDRQQSAQNSALIPIVMFNNSSHWIEWVVIVRIIDNIDIGVSFTYDEYGKTLTVSGIHLDKLLLMEQHMLVSPNHDCHCFDNWTSYITDIDICGDLNEIENKMKDYKQKYESLKGFIYEFIHTNNYESLKQPACFLVDHQCQSDFGCSSPSIEYTARTPQSTTSTSMFGSYFNIPHASLSNTNTNPAVWM